MSTRTARRDLIRWEGFGFEWEIHPQAQPLRAIMLSSAGIVRGIAIARTRAGLILAMWRAARRERGAR